MLLSIYQSRAGTVTSHPGECVTQPPASAESEQARKALEEVIQREFDRNPQLQRMPNMINYNNSPVVTVSPVVNVAFDVENHVINRLSNYSQNIQTFYEQARKDLSQSAWSAYAWVCNHKGALGLCAAFIAYGAVQRRIFCLEHRLKRRGNWSLNTVFIHETVEQEQEDDISVVNVDIDLLVNAVQHRYVDKENIFDCVQPLSLFMTAVDEELADLRFYRRLIHFVRKYYLGIIFYYSAELFHGSRHRIARLAAIKSSFISWLASIKQEALQRLISKQGMNFSPVVVSH